MRVEWTPQAKNHLQDIIDYYTSLDPKVGLNIFESIQSKVSFLESFPRLGRTGFVKNTLELPVSSRPPYFIVYELLPDEDKPEIISIMAVFSGRQDR